MFTLPRDIVPSILSRLDLDDYSSASQVNNFFNQCAKLDHVVEAVCSRLFCCEFSFQRIKVRLQTLPRGRGAFHLKRFALDVPKNAQCRWPAIHNFDDMLLCDSLIRAIYAYGFENPSAIQQKALVPLLAGCDMLIEAQSGTGKTSSFVISILQHVNAMNRTSGLLSPVPQALVVVPSREHAHNIHRLFQQLAEYMQPQVELGLFVSGLETHASCHVAIGTPSGLLLQMSLLDLSCVSMLVVDEADHTLQGSHCERVHQLADASVSRGQTVLLSATVTDQVLEFCASRMATRVVRVTEPSTDHLHFQGIRQYYIQVERDQWKLDTVCDLYCELTISQSIIYCNSRRKAVWLSEQLRAREFTVSTLHGDMTHQQRNSVTAEFRRGTSRILISTDLMSRSNYGVDVSQVSMVINYDLPTNKETYIHRCGRSGRTGRTTVAVSLITADDADTLRSIEQLYAAEILEMPADIQQKLY